MECFVSRRGRHMQLKQPLEFFNETLPGIDPAELHGKLLVIEGPDAVGRTTQVDKLRQWLEQEGHAVLDTGMGRGALAGEGVKPGEQGEPFRPPTDTPCL